MPSPVILGMNNPYSKDSRFDLAPFPKRSAGYRLWAMLNALRPTPRALYMRRTDRRNLLHEVNWCPIKAREASKGLWDSLRGRTVLVLGHDVRRVLWLEDSPELLWRERDGVRWCFVPHPSGLNRWYNSEFNRTMVGLRLEELVYGTFSV